MRNLSTLLVGAVVVLGGRASARADTLELHGVIGVDFDAGDDYHVGQPVTVLVTVDRQVIYDVVQLDGEQRRAYSYEPSDDYRISVSFDGTALAPITVQGEIISTPAQPAGVDIVRLSGQGGGLGVNLSLFTTTADEHPFPLELHEFSSAQLVIMQAGDSLFTAFIDWAQPVRDDLILLQDLERSITSIRTTKATQASVDLVAAAVATKASQISVDNLVFQVAAIQAQVGSASASILGVLANHSTELAAVDATLAQVLANQAVVNAKLDLIISRLPGR